MGKKITQHPLFFHSKLLCFSSSYLFTTLFFSLYLSYSPSSTCFFRSSPFHPIQSPLFSYPPSYRESKHPLPTLRPNCSSPVFFSGNIRSSNSLGLSLSRLCPILKYVSLSESEYSRVLTEIDESSRNSRLAAEFRYINGVAESFGGNFSESERFSFFDRWKSGNEIPCGFFKPFPVHAHDRTAMENCNGVVVVSAIFGDHDKIRQPRGVGSKTLSDVCFFMFVDDATLRGLQRHKIIPNKPEIPYTVGAWRLVNVSTEGLYPNPAMNGVIPKYLVHRLFPNSMYSVWVDAKLQLMVDPLLLVHSLVVKEGVDMAISKHPFFKHTMEEAMATARWRKWLDVDALRLQMETYCENGLRPWSLSKLPYPSDVPDTALIIRKHGEANNLFSCLMFNEMEGFNHRDQLAFAFVRDKSRHMVDFKMNMFDVEVFEQVTSEFRHNLHKEGAQWAEVKATGPTKKVASRAQLLSVNGGLGKCKGYFEEMWGQ